MGKLQVFAAKLELRSYLEEVRNSGDQESVFAITEISQTLEQLGANIVVRDRRPFAFSNTDWALHNIVVDDDYNI